MPSEDWGQLTGRYFDHSEIGNHKTTLKVTHCTIVAKFSFELVIVLQMESNEIVQFAAFCARIG